MSKRICFLILPITFLLIGCGQAKDKASENIPTRTWSSDDQAKYQASVGWNQQPVLIDDKDYLEIFESKSFNESKFITRGELLKKGFKAYCKKAYQPRPEPKVINYDTGETEPVKEAPSKVVAFECQTIRQSNENPKTYTPLKWWSNPYGKGISQEEFNDLTGRGVVIHDYSKPWP